MRLLDLTAAQEFFSAQAALPSMVYVGGSPEAADAGSRLGVPSNHVVAAYRRAIRGFFLSAAVFTPHELRISGALLSTHQAPPGSPGGAFRTVALDQIAEVRPGFEIAEIVLRSGERVRLHGDLNAFLRLCVECGREAGPSVALSNH
ncbi:MAG TPA: hypothetical protein VF278_19305 [Pirellulales bacterium]